MVFEFLFRFFRNLRWFSNVSLIPNIWDKFRRYSRSTKACTTDLLPVRMSAGSKMFYRQVDFWQQTGAGNLKLYLQDFYFTNTSILLGKIKVYLTFCKTFLFVVNLFQKLLTRNFENFVISCFPQYKIWLWPFQVPNMTYRVRVL